MAPCCKCAEEIAELRADKERLWVYFTNLVDQNGRVVTQMNDLRISHA
jgi:hypothetical protein